MSSRSVSKQSCHLQKICSLGREPSVIRNLANVSQLIARFRLGSDRSGSQSSGFRNIGTVNARAEMQKKLEILEKGPKDLDAFQDSVWCQGTIKCRRRGRFRKEGCIDMPDLVLRQSR